MKRTLTCAGLSLGVCCWLVAGCDVKPEVPAIQRGSVQIVSISPGDVNEIAAVKGVESARANYQYRLEVLQGYYRRVGNADKYVWSDRELYNLKTAQTFKWQGFEAVPPKGENLESTDERQLVEEVIAARKSWLDALDELESFYRNMSKVKSQELGLVRNVKARFDPVYTYTYYLDAEIPPADLKPVEVVPEADRMYEQAKRLFWDGKGWLHIFASTDYQKERKAMVLFREIIRKYPHSTKIALSAYYLADIYKEYFNEDVRAVAWYERSWQWDPSITEPARFQAAAVYDLRLLNPAKAVECYRMSLKDDPWRFGNADTARRRIKELTNE